MISLSIGVVWAGGGPIGIDHRLNEDNSGIWKISNQPL
jgi:undecaprenyl-diphosphatase